jgi:hypothetical protein
MTSTRTWQAIRRSVFEWRADGEDLIPQLSDSRNARVRSVASASSNLGRCRCPATDVAVLPSSTGGILLSMLTALSVRALIRTCCLLVPDERSQYRCQGLAALAGQARSRQFLCSLTRSRTASEPNQSKPFLASANQCRGHSETFSSVVARACFQPRYCNIDIRPFSAGARCNSIPQILRIYLRGRPRDAIGTICTEIRALNLAPLHHRAHR